MGIKGLHSFLKSNLLHVNVFKYTGKKAGVDAHGWLHRGANSRSCTSKESVVESCLKRLHMSRTNGVIPVMVFDGGNHPMKAKLREQRKR